MPTSIPDDEAYCREVESHLCRKNDGHLIRLVGPAFELVRGWAEQGIPLSIVCRGVDQYFERYHAKGPRRRPVRIDFCEADVLGLFDNWRRATGISLSGAAAGETRVPKRRESLQAHLDRALTRLGARATEPDLPAELVALIAEIRQELTPWMARVKGLRGEPRQRLLERLAELDASLLETARRGLAPGRLDDFVRAAASELEPFRDRMQPEAFARSLSAETDRQVRDGLRLPRLAVS